MKPFLQHGIGGIQRTGLQEHAGTTICIHGGPGANCLTLYPFFPEEQILGEWYFIDLPNHGRSCSTNDDWSKETCLRHLQHFASTLPKPLRLIGLSFGANVALEWANAYPEDIELFVGISGCGDIQSVIQHQGAVIQKMPAELLALMARLEKAEGAEADYLNNRVWLDSLDIWLEGNPGKEIYKQGTIEFRSNPIAAAGYIQSWLEPYIHRSNIDRQLQQLQELQIPTLLIWGRDDRMGSPECAMGYNASALGIDSYLIIDGAGHCPFVDQPEQFFSALEQFFRRS